MKYNNLPLTGDSIADDLNLTYSLNKPNEIMYANAAMNFGVSPKDCYVVGTSYKDFCAGKKAGMNTIHIRGWESFDKGFKIKDFEGKPDYTINKRNMRSGLEKIFNSLK